MGDNYCVRLELRCKDEKKIVSLLQDYIRKNPDGANFGLEKHKSEGVGTDTIDDLVAIMLAGWGTNKVSKKRNKDGLTTYCNGFSCSYGWWRVMVGMFYAMAEALEDRSRIVIDRDEGLDEYVVKDGEAKQVR